MGNEGRGNEKQREGNKRKEEEERGKKKGKKGRGEENTEKQIPKAEMTNQILNRSIRT